MSNYLKSEYLHFDISKNTVILDSKFMFAFRHFDGFSHRLLNYDLYVDTEYNFVCYMTAKNVNCISDDINFSLLFESKLPTKIKQSLAILINDQFNRINKEYKVETFVATDLGSTHILYNINNETKSINLYDNIISDPQEFKSKNEKRLLVLIQLITDWIENLYNLIAVK